MDHGLWTMEYGPWTMDDGPRTMDYGPWTIKDHQGPLWTIMDHHGPLTMYGSGNSATPTTPASPGETGGNQAGSGLAPAPPMFWASESSKNSKSGFY